MGFGFRLEVWGEMALFSRPELRVERMSYDVITPSAARGILEAILWKPAIRYVIDQIYVLNPIAFTNIRRNEVSAVASCNTALSAMNGSNEPMYIATHEKIQQRASMVLTHVHYVIEAHFEMTERAGERDSAEKFYAMFLRRARNGQCYHTPYLGCREFPAHFRLWSEDEIPTCGETRDLGLMLWDMDYQDLQGIAPIFFRATLQDGVMDLRGCETYQ